MTKRRIKNLSDLAEALGKREEISIFDLSANANIQVFLEGMIGDDIAERRQCSKTLLDIQQKAFEDATMAAVLADKDPEEIKVESFTEDEQRAAKKLEEALKGD